VNLLDGIFDTRCVGCGGWGTVACDRCVHQWTAEPRRTATARGVPLVALGNYRGGLRSVILAAKHRGAHAIIRRFGAPLRAAIRPFDDALVIPMPSSRSGFRARGYGLSVVMARSTGLPIADCLVLDDAGSQRGRHRDERRVRAMHLAARRPPVGTRVVIVDDVVTTGASVDAAIAACQGAGLRVVGVVVVASARYSPVPPRAMRVPQS
jgi:predicted amidophosphoribosyltransferase